MRNLKKLISSLILAVIVGFVLIGTACNQTTTDNEIKSQVSENGEPRLVVQLGHSAEIRSLAYSRDSKFILTGSVDRIAILWDANKQKEIRRFVGHKSGINAVAFSNDNRFVLTGSGQTYIGDAPDEATAKDSTARIWNIENGKEIIRTTEVEGAVTSVAFSNNGEFFLTGISQSEEGNKTVAYLWDSKSGKKIQVLKSEFRCSYGSKSSVEFSPDDTQILVGCHSAYNDKFPTQIWDVKTGKQIRQFENNGTAKFSADGKKIFTSDGNIFISYTGQLQKKVSFSICEGLFSPNEQFIVGKSRCGAETEVKIWNLETNNSIWDSSNIQTFSDKKTPVSYLFSADSKKVLIGYSEGFSLLKNLETQEEKIFLSESISSRANFSPNGNFITDGFGFYDLKGKEKSFLLPKGLFYSNFLPNGQEVFVVRKKNENEMSGELFNIRTEKSQATINFDAIPFGAIEISPNGKQVMIKDSSHKLSIWELSTGEKTFETHLFKYDDFDEYLIDESPVISDYATKFSPNGKTIFTETLSTANSKGKRFIRPCLIDIDSGEISLLFNPKDDVEEDYPVRATDFSPNGRFIASAGGDEYSRNKSTIILWETSTGKEIKRLKGQHSENITSVKFSPDGKYLLTAGNDRFVILWEVESGKVVNKFESSLANGLSADFSPDGRYVITGSHDGAIAVWNANSYKEICRISSFQNGDWIVTTPDGRFDTNNLDKVEGMHWIMPGEPLRPLPIEIFMRQYYEPRLLARILKCHEEKNCERELKPLPALNSLNRTQPNVKITDIKLDSEGSVEVIVEVANAKSEGQKDTFGSPLESGVFDVRLFRDGQLVAYAPKNVSDELTAWEWIKSWFVEIPKKTGEVELDAGGKAILKFPKIKLPKTGIDKVEFSAYAFNTDQIKSETSRQVYQFNPQTVKGRAYIISMGVNYTEKPNSNLRFTANDAQQMQENLSRRLIEQGVYEEVVKIPLISDYTVNAGGKTIASKAATSAELKTGQINVTENTATKSHFKAVFDVLGGKTADGEILKTIKNSDKLHQANPEDLIVISVSSHGNNDDNGVFYLLASDGETISSDELSLWLRDVDGGELSLIIDACRAASAVESADFKPAPMNSRSLGQLSYDKGMRILTATQADNVALETNETRQGLLSYALLQNGLNEFSADFKPQDNRIVMSEWLNFGVERVPRLWEESQAGQVKIVRETNDTSETESQQRQEKTQQPSLFDFSRKRQDTTLEKRNGKLSIPTVVESPKIKPVSTPKLEVSPTSSNSLNPLPTGFNGRVIKYDTVIVRASDSEESAKLGEVLRNDPIKIGERKGKWFRVTTVSGIEGWMHGNSLEFIR